MRLGRLAICATAAAVAACSEPTGPEALVDVRVTNLIGPEIVEVDGDAYVKCTVHLEATVQHGTARWGEVLLRYSFGLDTATVDTQLVDSAQIRNAWGQDDIRPGNHLTTYWVFHLGAPGHVSMEHRFSDGTPATTLSFACGPTPDVPTTPPVITVMSVSPSDTLQPGDVITVTYAATSTLGMYRTTIAFGGGCADSYTFPENLVHAVARTINISVPAHCSPGSKLGVTAIAMDAGFQQVTRGAGVLIPLIDTRKPSLQARFLTGGLDSNFYVGDTLRIAVDATDNHALRAIIWDTGPGTVAESIPAGSSSYYTGIVRTLGVDRLSATRLRVTALDSSGNTTRVQSTATGFRVFPVAPPGGTARIAHAPVVDAVFDLRRQRVYLLYYFDARLGSISIATGNVLPAVPIGVFGNTIDLTEGGDSLIIASGGPALTIVDLRFDPPVVSSRPITNPAQSAVLLRMLGGDTAFVKTATSQMLLLDLATGTQTPIATFPAVLERSYDRHAVIINPYAGPARRYDVRTNTLGPAGDSTTVGGRQPSPDAAGLTTAVGANMYDVAMQKTGRMERFLDNNSVVTRITPDGRFHFTGGGPAIVRSRVSTGLRIDGIRLPSFQPDLLRISDDGTWLFSASQNKVVVYDLRVLP